MAHPDRRRYGGLDLAPPDVEDMGPARFAANFDADFATDHKANVTADASADYVGAAPERKGKLSADTSLDFPAAPTGPAAEGFRRK